MKIDVTVDRDEAEKKPDEIVRFWLNEIDDAKKREKDFRVNGQRVLDIYSAKKHKETPFNILFSNTETLLPALYSAVPRPVVQRRFKDEDPMGKAAATAGQRGLEFLVDTNVEGYETFDEGVRAATLDALLPGRGWTCVKYDADLQGAGAEEEANGEAEEPVPYLKTELVCLDSKTWNRVFIGYAKKWSKVPWIAFEEQIDREEATRLFGRETAKMLRYTAENERREHDDEQGETSGRSTDEERHTGERKTTTIYQIWDKAGGKKVRYLATSLKERLLKVEDDPLELTGFYPCPRPLQFVEKSSDLLPVALYLFYENQANELNRLTRRLNKVIEAIKVRGVYAGDVSPELSQLMKGDDNELIPAESTSSLAFEKGLQNAIWMMPIQELIIVAEKLYQAREMCKRVIYEITGIADIIRGASVASETLGAQQIKENWGKIRLGRLQKEVQRYARDLLRMLLEMAASKFSEETWAKMTGLPFVTTMQRQQAEAVASAGRMTGQPPDPQTVQALQAPVWGQVLKVLRDDMQRAYRIDIETNSTIEPEAAEDQKHISELMTAMGQYLNGVGPLVAKGVMPFGAAQSMLLAISRRFRFGTEVEEYIKQMKEPQPEDDGKAAAAQAEQAKFQLEQQKMQMEAQKAQTDAQQMQATELAKHQREVQAMQQKADLDHAALQADLERERVKADTQLKMKQMELAAQRAIEQMKAHVEQETELKKASVNAATQIAVAKVRAVQHTDSAMRQAEG